MSNMIDIQETDDFVYTMGGDGKIRAFVVTWEGSLAEVSPVYAMNGAVRYLAKDSADE